MKNFKLKSTLLALLVVCIFCSFKSVESNVSSCGTIVVEGDIMLTETEDLNDSIEDIILTSTSGLTYVFAGCGSNICTTNIRSLPSGTYDADVYTALCTINGLVVKK